MKASVDKTISEYDMLGSAKLLYVALSGGADSVCLFHIMRDICKERGISLRIAHVNHNLRVAAKSDEDFVRALADEFSVEVVVKSVDVKAYAKLHSMGLEEAGRAVRYAFFDEIGGDGIFIATAHSASDNSETFFMNLLRGAGPRGLSGISPMRGNIIRPLIECTRHQIEEFLKKNGYSHIEDESNRDESFFRNKIRHSLLGYIRENFAENIDLRLLESSKILREEDEFLEGQARAYINLEKKANQIELDCKKLLTAAPVLVTRALRLVLKEHFSQNLSHAHTERLCQMIEGQKHGDSMNLPMGIFAKISYDKLILSSGMPLFSPIAETSLTLGENYIDNFGKITVNVIKNLQLYEKKHYTFLIDCDIIDVSFLDKLRCRSRREHDEIKLDKRKTKSLKKLYIDEKIEKHQRDSLPIILFENEIVCAYPFGVAEKFAVKEDAHTAIGILFEGDVF